MRISLTIGGILASVLLIGAGCQQPDSVSLDLLPATNTGRVEAALRIPSRARLHLNVSIDAPEVESEGEGAATPILEIWVHTESKPSGHLIESRRLEDGDNDLSIGLDRLARRQVLLQLVLKGASPEHISWQSATLEGATSAAGRDGQQDPEGWRIQARSEAPNVILYVIDTLRADSLGVYGASKPTRWIDELGGGGIRFEQALTPATWTRPATASLLTGVYPSTHGAEDRPDRLPESAFMLAEHLRLRGYSTAAVNANGNLDPVWGFDQGFEFFVRPQVPDRDPEGRPRRHLHADEVHEVGLEQWNLRRGAGRKPVFLYVHTVDPHGPYDPPEWLLDDERPDLGNTNQLLDELNQRKREATEDLVYGLLTLYAGEVAYSDRAFGAFMTALKPLDDTLIIFTSDHGEAFQEHGFSSHGMSLYEEEQRVPLILWWPGQLPARTVVEQPVSLVDVLPTVLALIDGEASVDGSLVQGVNLRQLWLQEPLREDLHRHPLMAELDYDGRVWSSLRDGDLKLMVHDNSNRKWLFDLASDPGERRNLIESTPAEVTDRLASGLAALREESLEREFHDPERTVANPIPEDVKENLRTLGYLQ